MAVAIMGMISVTVGGLYINSLKQSAAVVASAEDQSGLRVAMARMADDLRTARHLLPPSAGQCGTLRARILNETGDEVDLAYCVQDGMLKRSLGGTVETVARGVSSLEVSCAATPPAPGNWNNNCSNQDELVHLRLTGEGGYPLQTTVLARNTFDFQRDVCLNLNHVLDPLVDALRELSDVLDSLGFLGALLKGLLNELLDLVDTLRHDVEVAIQALGLGITVSVEELLVICA